MHGRNDGRKLNWQQWRRGTVHGAKIELGSEASRNQERDRKREMMGSS